MFFLYSAANIKRKPKTFVLGFNYNFKINSFLYYLFACDPSQFPFASDVSPHPQGLSAFINLSFY